MNIQSTKKDENERRTRGDFQTKKDRPSILILFWHGLGDVIMATPAFRAFSLQHPDSFIGITVKGMIYNSGILNRCPYFHRMHIIPDVWKERSFRRAFKRCIKEGERIQREFKYDKLICVNHQQKWRYGIHKIYRTANELGVGLITDTQTELYLSDEDRADASNWLKQHGYEENNFIFLHRKTDYPPKDMPDEVAQAFLKMLPPLPVIEVGKSYPLEGRPVNFSFAILEKAGYTLLVDSVFLHAADALGKDVTAAYFAIRPGIVEEVKPLNIQCNCVESYTRRLDPVRKLWFLIQKGIYQGFFKGRYGETHMDTNMYKGG